MVVDITRGRLYQARALSPLDFCAAGASRCSAGSWVGAVAAARRPWMYQALTISSHGVHRDPCSEVANDAAGFVLAQSVIGLARAKIR